MAQFWVDLDYGRRFEDGQASRRLAGPGTAETSALAGLLGVPHFDTDAFFWMPTDPPFTTPRPMPERLRLLMEALPPEGGWVLSGSAINWGKPLELLYDFIVYLHLDPSIRMGRLYQRERARYGSRIETGGDMAEASADFLAWAAAYDTAGSEQRSRVPHENWLDQQTAPVLRLDSSQTVPELAMTVISEAGGTR